MIRFPLTPKFSLENYGVVAAGFRTKGFPQMKTGEEKSLFKDTGFFEAEKQAVLDSLYEIKETEAELNDLLFSESDTTLILQQEGS